jgi:large conductance mechanosensitive channel
MSIIKEFKEFAMRGNLIDMAVAVVMGDTFEKVVSAFIDGMVMPLIGKVVSGVDFKSLKYVLVEAQFDVKGKEIVPEDAIKYGEFITTTIDFVLVALCVFILIKTINQMRRIEIETQMPAAIPVPTEDQKLLAEIRDLLKK